MSLSFQTADASAIAGELYLARKSRAVATVRTGQMAAHSADLALYPWLAIACLCGADLPELAPLIDSQRNPVWLYGAAREISEAEARRIVASDICPPARWAMVLGRTRDHALLAALTDPSRDAAARQLVIVSAHLAALGSVAEWSLPSAMPKAA